MFGIFSQQTWFPFILSSASCVTPKHVPSPLWASEFPSETPGWSRRSSGSYSDNASRFGYRGLVLRVMV